MHSHAYTFVFEVRTENEEPTAAELREAITWRAAFLNDQDLIHACEQFDTIDEPIFQHDCTIPGCCTFIGTTLGQDIYTHNEGKSLSRRMSSEPSDYCTLLITAYQDLRDNPKIDAALKLWEKHNDNQA